MGLVVSRENWSVLYAALLLSLACTALEDGGERRPHDDDGSGSRNGQTAGGNGNAGGEAHNVAGVASAGQPDPGGNSGGNAGASTAGGSGGMHSAGGPAAGSGGMHIASAGKGGTGGQNGGSAGEGGEPGILFQENFEDADQPLKAWELTPTTESRVCMSGLPDSVAKSSTFSATGNRSLQITLETANDPTTGVEFVLVRQIPKQALYYSARYYIDGAPVRDPVNGWFAFFDFFTPLQPDTPCSAQELWNLNLGAKAPFEQVAFLWDNRLWSHPEAAETFTKPARPFRTNQWVHVEVRLDYYGPKQRQYELYLDGELAITVNDLTAPDGGQVRDSPLFWRIGLSANHLNPSKATIYLDDVKISTERVGP